MPIISHTDRKTLHGRLVIAAIYLALCLGSATMVFPFLVMVTGSMGTYFDYERRSPLPRFLVSREDRFLRALCEFFPPSHRGSLRQVRSFFPTFPADWTMWSQIGDEIEAADAWAQTQLQRIDDPDQRPFLETMADDYKTFSETWDLRETILAYDNRHVGPFLLQRYGNLDVLNKAWEISVDDFAKINAAEWSGEPIDQASYVPLEDARYEDLLAFREDYRRKRFSPHLRHDDAPVNYLRPACLAYVWEDFAAKALDIEDGQALRALPFPVGPGAPDNLQEVWKRFLRERFPLRHMEIHVTPHRQEAFEAFLQTRFRNVDYMNRLMLAEDPDWQPVQAWNDVRLTAHVPSGPMATVWMDFLRTEIPIASWILRDTLPEQAFQAFALQRYGTLSGINKAYGLDLTCLQQLRVPFAPAFLTAFAHHEWAFTLHQVVANYAMVMDYLFYRGSAVRNTIILVGLTILITLTVNPMAGYALSRFRLRQTERILVFCLATMAFPAAVTAIPGFLLLRDLGFLNTFAALVLPGAANGMTIFLLKGFFDSLPQDLFEAATIDGAPEWRIFLNISLPLVKPILAVSALNAFILSYNGWAWAIIVCQDRKMWTMAVWTYQFYQTLGSQPFAVMAAFIVNSIPVLLVFLFCQKIILRGIILPQMK